VGSAVPPNTPLSCPPNPSTHPPPHPRLPQVADEATKEAVNRALSACGKTMDDFRDPDRRHTFHAQYGRLAVSWHRTIACTGSLDRCFEWGLLWQRTSA